MGGSSALQECARLADLLVYQVGADPSHLRPPGETFTPYGHDRYVAGLYVVTVNSTWRQEFRASAGKLVAQGGAQQGGALITCLLPKLAEITDQTKQNISAHLNGDLSAITGVATQPNLSMAPRPITGGLVSGGGGGATTEGGITVQPRAPSAETEQPITSTPSDVYMPPTETPPGPPPGETPPGGGVVPPPTEAKEFPWVPVVIGVGVVGGIGLLLLAKKKKRK